jgi:hypothetical protein
MKYRIVRRVITAGITWFATMGLVVSAHSFSTAYMDVTAYQGQPVLLWKVALHDLAQARLISAKQQDQISWQQVLDSETTLQHYVARKLAFSSNNQACSIAPLASSEWMLQRLQQDLYLLLPIRVACPSADAWQLHYQALFDIEHSHKLLLSWQVPGAKAKAVLSETSAYFPALSQHGVQ